MSEHQRGGHASALGEDDAVLADDALCDALRRGEDVTAGQDPIAGMLAGLAREVSAPCPPAPQLEDLLPTDDGVHTTVFPAVSNITDGDVGADAAASAAPPTRDADVIHLEDSRVRRHRVGWLGAGLTGAAAATLVIAGGGAMVHNAEPGDPLWGLNESIFGNHAAVVKLATTLEEADSRNANGDVQGALELLEQAKSLAQEMNATAKKSPAETVKVTVTESPTTHTVTLSPEPTTVEAPPVTVTTRIVVTPSPKPSAQNLAPGIKPTTQAVPLTAIMPSDEITTPTAPSVTSAPQATQAVPLPLPTEDLSLG